MKKKLLIMLLTLALVVSIGLPVQAASKELTVIINGETQSYNQPPVIIKGSTLVPLRGIFESLGATVSWNGETKTVIATSRNKVIFLKIGSVDTIVNGENVKISVPAQIINKSTMVPLRFVSEALGASVGWDGNTRTITIQYSPKVEDTKTKEKTSEIIFLKQEISYKKASGGEDMPLTAEEFNKTKKLALEYLSDINHINKPIPKELEDLKEYQYVYIEIIEGTYNISVLNIIEGYEKVLDDKTLYLMYMNGKGDCTDGDTMDLDLEWYLYPIKIDKADPNTCYEGKINRTILLSEFKNTLDKISNEFAIEVDEEEANNETEIINFEDKELETMIKRALGKKSTDMITKGDIADIVSIEIMGPYINISEEKGFQFTNLGDFTSTSINDDGSYVVDGEEKNYLGNVSTLKDISNFPSLMYLKVSFQSNLVNVKFHPKSIYFFNLDLSANNLSDISGLANLKVVTKLNLSHNKISDISAIRELKELEILHLYNNNIIDINPVSNLNNLEGLTLSNNNIKSIVPVSNLKKLTFLILGGNDLDNITQLSGLTQLEDLRIYDNRITDISPISGLKNLRLLSIGNNGVTDISPISGLTNLNKLYLYENQIRDINAISGLKNLITLSLSDNQIKDYTPIKALSNLEALEIDGDNDFDDFEFIQGIFNEDTSKSEKNKDVINFEDKELEKMLKRALGKSSSEDIREEDISNITEIEILGPYIRIEKKKGLDIVSLGDFDSCSSTTLKTYTIDGKILSDDGNISSIKDLVNFPSLKCLTIRVQPNLEDINYFLNFNNIVELDLSANSIEDISGLANYKNLTRLCLNDNQIRDISILSKLKNLETLELSWTKIRDIITLSELRDLQYLNIGGTEIRDISALSELRDLQYLNISGTKIRDISVLSELKNLEGLSLYSCEIRDISVLSELKNLQRLTLYEIRDISALSELKNLETLFLYSCEIRDTSVLSNLKKLKKLYLNSSKISDVSFLSELTNLETLVLNSNKISNIDSLSSLNNLKSLIIRDNPIKDYSPIKSLSNLEKLEIDGDYDYNDFDLIQ